MLVVVGSGGGGSGSRRSSTSHTCRCVLRNDIAEYSVLLYSYKQD